MGSVTRVTPQLTTSGTTTVDTRPGLPDRPRPLPQPGPASRDICLTFQQEKGLTPDGIFGPAARASPVT
ncbi:hypothetical protein GCM10027160_03110 [Streptomyces calidiresistens]